MIICPKCGKPADSIRSYFSTTLREDLAFDDNEWAVIGEKQDNTEFVEGAASCPASHEWNIDGDDYDNREEPMSDQQRAIWAPPIPAYIPDTPEEAARYCRPGDDPRGRPVADEDSPRGSIRKATWDYVDHEVWLVISTETDDTVDNTVKPVIGQWAMAEMMPDFSSIIKGAME